jgi:hypothetical protein
MKKILAVMLVLVYAVAMVYATSVKHTYRPADNLLSHSPADVQCITLHSAGTNQSKDTLLTTDINVYGPYSLSTSNSTGSFSAFSLYFDALTGTTPVAAFDYAYCGSADLRDTVGGWTSIDTLAELNENKTVTLSGAMKYIVFRLNNYDNTTTAIPKNVIVCMKENSTYQYKR